MNEYQMTVTALDDLEFLPGDVISGSRVNFPVSGTADIAECAGHSLCTRWVTGQWVVSNDILLGSR